MKIEVKQPKPLENFLEPAIQFPLQLTYNNREVPIAVSGLLLAEDNKILVPLSEIEKTGTSSKDIGSIGAEGTGKDQYILRESTHDMTLIATLSQKAIDYIDSLRDKNAKGDVNLKLFLRVRILKSNTVIAPLHSRAPAEVGPPLRERLEDLGKEALITYGYKRDYAPEAGNLWVISGSNEPVFLNITDMVQEVPVTIYESNWIHDFAPQLGLGRFVLAELAIPAPISIKGKHSKRVDKAFEALQRMEKEIREGEWTEAIEKSRPVAELLREEDLVKSLLTKHGYHEDAANSLIATIKGLFEYGSKFLHKVAKDGTTIPPEIKAEKEDAYLTYTVSTALVNLLTQKARKPESH
jgi:hypothetical protein